MSICCLTHIGMTRPQTTLTIQGLTNNCDSMFTQFESEKEEHSEDSCERGTFRDSTHILYRWEMPKKKGIEEDEICLKVELLIITFL